MKNTAWYVSFVVGIIVGCSLNNLVGNLAWSFPKLPDRDTTALVDASDKTLPPFHRSTPSVWFNGTSKLDPVLLDAYNPIYHYLQTFDRDSREHPIVNFPELPLFDSWIHYPEAYHNHFERYRGTERIIFMEVGVQSGGKIPMLRDYFGPGFVYVGIDINPSTKMFESADWVHIEIGNSADPNFWRDIKQKYPVVDIFLDDGGHTMDQQRMSIQEMLPHVQPDGVFACEDLATSWAAGFGGIRGGGALNPDFVRTTMVGLVYQTMDWLHAGFIFDTDGARWNLNAIPDSSEIGWSDWWPVVHKQVKHIHYYNQIVVFEKGSTYDPRPVRTVGKSIPYGPSGEHEPVDWDMVMKKVQSFTNSKWNW